MIGFTLIVQDDFVVPESEQLDDASGIIEKILAKRPDLTSERIHEMIEQKKREGKGLLSEEGAARLVAEALLVDTETRELRKVRIHNLVSGLNDVTLTGRVVVTWPIQEFQRRDGSQGKVTRITLADRTGRVRCAVWDKKADELSKAADLQGKLLRISHGYTREGLSGEPELHAGDRSELSIDPSEVDPADFPRFDELFVPIAKISESDTEVNLVGLVQADPKLFSFTRNGREGKVLRALLADRTGMIALAAWNERAEELRDLKKQDVLQIINARVRRDTAGALELHAESRSQVAILRGEQARLERPTSALQKISDLTSALGHANLLVRVVKLGELREARRLTGETVRLSRLLVGDETGLVNVALWDERAELISKLREGDALLIEGARVRERMGEMTLSAGRLTTISVNPGGGEPPLPVVTRIGALSSARGLVIVEGTISEEPSGREIVTERGETVQVASLRLKDETGDVRISFWRQHAELAVRLRVGMKLRATGLRVRPGFTGGIELTSTPMTAVEILEKPAIERPMWGEVRQIIALKEEEQAWIRALVLEVSNDAFLFPVCGRCGHRIGFKDDGVLCDECGAVDSMGWRLSMRVRVDDGTGALDLDVETLKPEALLGKSLEWAQKEILAKRVSRLALPMDLIGKLTGMRIEASGVVRRDPATGKLGFLSKDIIALEQ